MLSLAGYYKPNRVHVLFSDLILPCRGAKNHEKWEIKHLNAFLFRHASESNQIANTRANTLPLTLLWETAIIYTAKTQAE